MIPPPHTFDNHIHTSGWHTMAKFQVVVIELLNDTYYS
jgi:hypothetical protein